ncbi:hypothetical protein EI77_04648 [Prosthecobacter fusiformis]|uniref:Uncharacterized protein n=1 Tax=Prosthecobacter fusiformis TaxID=48464 RepID=A0A4R7RK39_9BACT|nr:hypothetical protein EI77_04648 [Prosthecobacter fusiformis]
MKDTNQEHKYPTEEQMELARQVGKYSQAVRNGTMPLDDAINILLRPPFNYPNRRHAWHVLAPGPPTP